MPSPSGGSEAVSSPSLEGGTQGVPSRENKLETIVPLPLPDDDAVGVPAINGDI